MRVALRDFPFKQICMTTQVGCNQIAFLRNPARHFPLAMLVPKGGCPWHSVCGYFMKVDPDAKSPAGANALKRFDEDQGRSIRRVTVPAVVDKNCTGLAIAERSAGFNKLCWLAINSWKRQIAGRGRIQHYKCGANSKFGVEFLRERYGMIADSTSSWSQLGNYLNEQSIGRGHGIIRKLVDLRVGRLSLQPR
jgi:hypothetical protein